MKFTDVICNRNQVINNLNENNYTAGDARFEANLPGFTLSAHVLQWPMLNKKMFGLENKCQGLKVRHSPFVGEYQNL